MVIAKKISDAFVLLDAQNRSDATWRRGHRRDGALIA